MKLLVTGGMGFIGSNFVRHLHSKTQYSIVNVDKLSYAANPSSLDDIKSSPRYHFHQVDILDSRSLEQVFAEEKPDSVVHLAAESHVDRSIDSPADFVQTNVVGTFNLLSCALKRFDELNSQQKSAFRFVHVSTDEVYGSLSLDAAPSTESSRYDPSSPYSASKAASDHLVRSWYITHGLPAVVTHAANNYGPFQYCEKFIPTIISRALHGRSIPVYGDGKNVRDWLHVEDHCNALLCLLQNGEPGETYNIGADNGKNNLELVHDVCAVLDRLSPLPTGESHSKLIEFVRDRKGHDLRYSLNIDKMKRDLGWQPELSWSTGIENTVRWYIDNGQWWANSQRND